MIFLKINQFRSVEQNGIVKAADYVHIRHNAPNPGRLKEDTAPREKIKYLAPKWQELMTKELK